MKTPDEQRAESAAYQRLLDATDAQGVDDIQQATSLLESLGVDMTMSTEADIKDRWSRVVWGASKYVDRRIAAVRRQFDWEDPQWRIDSAVEAEKDLAIVALHPLRAFRSFQVRAQKAVLVPHLHDIATR